MSRAGQRHLGDHVRLVNFPRDMKVRRGAGRPGGRTDDRADGAFGSVWLGEQQAETKTQVSLYLYP